MQKPNRPRVFIPDEAWDAVLAATPAAPFEARSDQQAAVDAAAPLIVAAELERLAAQAGRTRRAIRSFGFTEYSEGKAEGVELMAVTLRSRAIELRGEA